MDFGGVEADLGVTVMEPLSPGKSMLPVFSGGVILCGRELLVKGVGGSCDGDGLANEGECGFLGLGEFEPAPRPVPGLVVPAS